VRIFGKSNEPGITDRIKKTSKTDTCKEARMTLPEQIPDICMEKTPLTNLPEVILPSGYCIRSIVEDEGYLWEQVMDQSYGGYAPGTFQAIMVENYDYDPERVRIMFDIHGQPCATATSWRQHYRWGPGIGYVLFVGVAKPYQGRGLGYQMTLHVLLDFQKHGFQSAILETDETRLPALKTYLKLGFLPRIVHPQQYRQWDTIFASLAMQPVRYPPEVRPPMQVAHPARPWPHELKKQGKKPLEPYCGSANPPD
jgi:mycothiol synthase